MSKKIICKFCRDEFIFSDYEQRFYKSKGFAEPQKCKNCRREAKTVGSKFYNPYYGLSEVIKNYTVTKRKFARIPIDIGGITQ